MSDYTAEEIQALSRLICKGSLNAVQQILKKSPSIANCVFANRSLLFWGARNVEMCKLLISYGADVNLETEFGTPLQKAVTSGNIEVVRVLLEAGASNLQKADGRSLVISAVTKSLELVKLLLEAGADIHEEYYASALECQMNALSLAIAHDKKEIADYLRSQGAVLPGDGSFTPPPRVLVELVPTDPQIDIHLTIATPEQPWVRLMTGGLSEIRAPVPDGDDTCPFAELRMDLPPDWKYDALDDFNFSWPIHWLRLMAKHIARNDMFLGQSTIISNPDGDEPIANTKMTCMLLTATETMEFQGKTIQPYQVLPLYTEEREFEKARRCAGPFGRPEKPSGWRVPYDHQRGTRVRRITCSLAWIPAGVATSDTIYLASVCE